MKLELCRASGEIERYQLYQAQSFVWLYRAQINPYSSKLSLPTRLSRACFSLSQTAGQSLALQARRVLECIHFHRRAEALVAAEDRFFLFTLRFSGVVVILVIILAVLDVGSYAYKSGLERVSLYCPGDDISSSSSSDGTAGASKSSSCTKMLQSTRAALEHWKKTQQKPIRLQDLSSTEEMTSFCLLDCESPWVASLNPFVPDAPDVGSEMMWCDVDKECQMRDFVKTFEEMMNNDNRDKTENINLTSTWKIQHVSECTGDILDSPEGLFFSESEFGFGRCSYCLVHSKEDFGLEGARYVPMQKPATVVNMEGGPEGDHHEQDHDINRVTSSREQTQQHKNLKQQAAKRTSSLRGERDQHPRQGEQVDDVLSDNVENKNGNAISTKINIVEKSPAPVVAPIDLSYRPPPPMQFCIYQHEKN